EQRAPLGQFGRDLGEHFPGAPYLRAGPGRGLRPAAGGEHGGGGAQGGHVGRRVALVGGVEDGGLVQSGTGLGEQVEGGGRGRGVALVGGAEGGGPGQSGTGRGEQVEGGGRGRGAAQHGVDVARRAGQ